MSVSAAVTASSAEYTLRTDAPHAILAYGRGSEAFTESLGGSVETDPSGAAYARLPFTHATAKNLRSFLRGRSVHIEPRDKAILAYLANNEKSGEDESVLWSVQLTDLLSEKVPGVQRGKIKTGWDLIHYMPLRYLDKTNPQSADELTLGEWSVVVGNVYGEPQYNAAKDFVKIVVQDIRGSRISATFFRQKWLSWMFKENDEVILYGNYSHYINPRGQRFPQIANAKIDKLGTIRGDLDMIPIYPQKASSKTYQTQDQQKTLLDRIAWIEDPVPAVIREKHQLMSRNEAYRAIHFPKSREQVEEARRRLAFDEFVRLQVFLDQNRDKVATSSKTPKTLTGWAEKFEENLPFKFTDQQQNALREIVGDLQKPSPMYRLLQGDVGVGKSELSAYAALVAVENGTQVAVLAPTDILATQLADRYQRTFDASGLGPDTPQVALLNGRVTGKKRDHLLQLVESGEVQVLVGTYAITNKAVQFQHLGLVIIDEQHKFGVDQRDRLISSAPQGETPDFLMMSATPIPRAISQVVYGHMDLTVVENDIGGRLPVETEWHAEPSEAWQRIREQVAAGHQAYVVAALVEESEKLEDVAAAESIYTHLSQNVFPDLSVGLMHGRLHRDEKSTVVDAFYRGDTNVLVATSVVEVGVNVPNATVMVILDADRFGIASLHQIRGRVGRGSDQSWCYLIADSESLEASDRLGALTESNNGFYLAERDLEIRGEGNLFGQLQTGSNEMFIGNLKEHRDLLDTTKRVAKQARKSAALEKEVDLLYAGKEIRG